MAQLRASQPIQAHAGLGRLHRQFPMHIRGDADHELAAEPLCGDRCGNDFLITMHVRKDMADNPADALQRRFGRTREPAEAGKLRA